MSPMNTICTIIVQEGQLDNQIKKLSENEKKFTRDAGVLEREFFQCIHQPHVIWVNTKWTREDAHNNAAESLMKVRRDDRIASAYFQPGLYFEIFCREMDDVSYRSPISEPYEINVICHGLVATKKLVHWNGLVREQFKALSLQDRLVRCQTFCNYYNPNEFVGVMTWKSQEHYDKQRMIGGYTIEERYYTGLQAGPSMLASYNQFYCKPLKISWEKGLSE